MKKNFFDNIPSSVKKDGMFCLWKYETRDGKATKVPYSVSGYKARSNDIDSFDSFENVCSKVKQYDGIGLGIFNGFSAIDIDDCYDGENFSEMAEDIINTMNSYTEFSPSGKGVRILFKTTGYKYDKDAFYINNQDLHLEVYVAGATSKFVTVTGNVIKDFKQSSEIEERVDELNIVLQRYMKRKTSLKAVNRNDKTRNDTDSLSDEEVLSLAIKAQNSEKFKKLWSGDSSDYKSDSEADLALCTILAFWCGDNPTQIKRLFGQSELFREEKWSRADYSSMTIRNAIDNCGSFYEKKDYYVSDRAKEILDKFNISNPNKYRETDIGAGRLFAELFKDEICYVPERKSWFLYDGMRWVKDLGSLHAMELMKDLADALWIFSLKAEKHQKDRFEKYVSNWQQRKYRETYIKDAQNECYKSIEAFDSNKYLLNCLNGTLDLKTFTFYDHKSDDFLTNLCPVNYDPLAHSDRFTRFIDEIMFNPDTGCTDVERANYLQKVLGYCISGETRFEALYILYGETTRNGKGTLMESVLKVLGDYGRTVRAESLAQKQFSNSQAPSEDIARLKGIRLANISEPSRDLMLNAALVKTLTGNDTINARFLNENSFDFKPEFKLYINTNYLPTISDITVFTSGRINVIPFQRHFSESEQDKSLKDEFSTPEVQSAILNWLLEGYKSVASCNTIERPQSVIAATEKYFEDSDRIGRFFKEKLEKYEPGEIKTSDLKFSFDTWCDQNGYRTKYNQTNFNEEISRHGQIIRAVPKDESLGINKTSLFIGYRYKSTGNKQ